MKVASRKEVAAKKVAAKSHESSKSQVKKRVGKVYVALKPPYNACFFLI